MYDGSLFYKMEEKRLVQKGQALTQNATKIMHEEGGKEKQEEREEQQYQEVDKGTAESAKESSIPSETPMVSLSPAYKSPKLSMESEVKEDSSNEAITGEIPSVAGGWWARLRYSYMYMYVCKCLCCTKME